VTFDVPTHDICEMAALYALGALDGDDLWRFNAHLLDGCDACALDVASFADAAAHLARTVPPAQPSPILRDRLLERVRGDAAERASLADLADLAVRESAAPGWRPHGLPGIAFKPLHLDEAKREMVLLVRAEPGARYPSHRHAALEEMYMLAGELRFEETVYRAGDYIRSEGGSIHAPSETPSGCMFLLRGSLDNEKLS
jgi:quercetin dioxygenase-like cupin family protein